ncbi:MAG: tetratricopeptide repeat protein [Pyrinomonadaceae bacterium]|nr:tetratricopeptide repeat protein [Pyrinomonadaceae bacterium]
MSKKTLNLEPIPYRIGMVVGGVIVVTILLLSAVRLIGDSIAVSSAVPEVTEFAKTMSPGNPKPYFSSSSRLEQSFKNEDLQSAISDARIAISYSPGDFSGWLALGRLLERAGDLEGAEKALRRASELAPSFAAVQWSLGNLLLRKDKTEEAFKLIRSAAESDTKYAGPAASIAWDIHEGDMSKVKSSIGESGPVKTALAVYLSKQKRYSEALDIWKALSKQERTITYLKEGKSIVTNLAAGKKFITAVRVAADLRPAGALIPKVGQVTNGGFESPLEPERPEFFQWKIVQGRIPAIGIAVDEKRSGAKSLAVFFEGVMGKEFRTVSQTVALKGGRRYSLRVHYKSSLKTDATVEWQVADTGGAGLLSQTDPIENNTDWTTTQTTFSVPTESDGVVVRLARSDCQRLRCPIFGKVWFDDIELVVAEEEAREESE